MDTSQSERRGNEGSRFSELEGVVLGLIWLLGPCSAYVIRTTVSRSPNSQWSGSAGAIYPLLRRLEARDLCISTSFSTGKRHGRNYKLTDQGRRVLHEWIGPPIGDEAASIPSDPIRTRLSFISSLSSDRQKLFIIEAKRIIQTHITQSEEECRMNKESDRTIDYLIARGALLNARVRLEWIKEVESSLDSLPLDKK